jgi:hypothetical protein
MPIAIWPTITRMLGACYRHLVFFALFACDTLLRRNPYLVVMQLPERYPTSQWGDFAIHEDG